MASAEASGPSRYIWSVWPVASGQYSTPAKSNPFVPKVMAEGACHVLGEGQDGQSCLHSPGQRGGWRRKAVGARQAWWEGQNQLPPTGS